MPSAEVLNYGMFLIIELPECGYCLLLPVLECFCVFIAC